MTFSRVGGLRKNSVREQRDLDGAGGPAASIPHRSERIAVQRARAVLPQCVQVIGGGIALVAGQPVLRVNGIPLLHASVAMGLCQDGGGSDGDAAAIALDERLLFDE